ncbi:MAG: DUF4783 domain-containing protein [Bacteroidales bacterium]|nr:DUF4783 domain-containing protein [Bacteroidales bacterium]
MKSLGIVLTLFMVMLASPFYSQNTDQVKKDFVRTFSVGKAAGMQKYFDGFVNVDLPGTTGLYTAVRSQSQLQDFFDKYPVKSFSMKEDGFTGKKYFLIGSFLSDKKSWNVYILLVPKKGSYCIQQMEIEETD